MKITAHKRMTVAWTTACTSAASLLMMQPAAATAQFAAQTGKSCGDCHTNANGGGPLTPFGEKFKANGDKLPK